MDNSKDILGILLKISLPALILMGVIKLTSYYYQFNIPIIEYLKLSEITTLFLSNIATYLIFMAIVYFILLSSLTKKYWVMAAILGVALLIVYLINEDLSFNSSKITILICVTVIFTSSLIYKIDISSKNTYFFLVYVFLLILSAISISSYSDAEDVKKGHVFSGTEITFTDTTIKSTDSFYYIGKTEGYIFFYDATTETPSIYNAENVKKIIFVSKKIRRGGIRPYRAPLVSSAL
jgi:hypothetical protein